MYKNIKIWVSSIDRPIGLITIDGLIDCSDLS